MNLTLDLNSTFFPPNSTKIFCKLINWQLRRKQLFIYYSLIANHCDAESAQSRPITEVIILRLHVTMTSYLKI